MALRYQLRGTSRRAPANSNPVGRGVVQSARGAKVVAVPAMVITGAAAPVVMIPSALTLAWATSAPIVTAAAAGRASR